MLSREADAVYWMSRYIERAENIARFVEVNGHLMLDLPSDAVNTWESLVMATGDQEQYLEHYETFTREDVIAFLTFDRRNPNSILSSLNAARENAKTVRGVISSEMFESLNRLFLMVQIARLHRVLENPYDFYTDVKQASHLFRGITQGTMTHGEAWHFCRLGEHVERADKTSRILDVKYFMLLPSIADVNTPFDNIQWSAVLKSTSALEMYRKEFGPVSPPNVCAFLILDLEFPRSIRHSVTEALKSTRMITGSTEGSILTPAERAMGSLCARLDYTTIEEIISGGLHEFLDDFQTQLNEADGKIHETFFDVRAAKSGVPIL